MQYSSKSVFKKKYLYFYLEIMQTLQCKKKKKNCIHKKYVSNAEPILDFWGPYAKLCRGGDDFIQRMNETHLTMFCFCTRGKLFFWSQARDFTTFTLHNLTVFYVESVTAPHYNKLSFVFS